MQAGHSSWEHEVFRRSPRALVARFKEKDILRLLQNEGIIRSRAKIEAMIRGARIYCEMAEKGEDFAAFCWSFIDGTVLKGDGRRCRQTPNDRHRCRRN